MSDRAKEIEGVFIDTSDPVEIAAGLAKIIRDSSGSTFVIAGRERKYAYAAAVEEVLRRLRSLEEGNETLKNNIRVMARSNRRLREALREVKSTAEDADASKNTVSRMERFGYIFLTAHEGLESADIVGDTVEEALEETGIGGIYDVFDADNPADVIRQMGHYIREAEEELPGGFMPDEDSPYYGMSLAGRIRELIGAIKDFLNDVRQRHDLADDEPFDCEYMNTLDRLVSEDTNG